MNTHPLKCPICYDFRILHIDGVKFERDNKLIGINIPFFKCPNCGKKDPLKPKKYYEELVEKEFKKLKSGEFTTLTFKHETKRFQKYEYLGFKYSPIDYFLIPGLFRQFDDGYLCPVFFDKDVLLYYNNHPNYSVRLHSFSSGNIYYNDQSLFNWGFGINRNGKIFKWLGDLDEDFRKEKMQPHLKRFQASNVDSDHDIFSKFYLSQIPFSEADAFQSSDNEVRLFVLKNQFEELFLNKYSFLLSKIQISELFEFYNPPILEDKEQIFNSYLSLNKLIVENLEISTIKKYMVAQTIISKEDLKSLGSIKILESLLKNVIKIENSSDIISPLYVLNDLRQLQGHLSIESFSEKYSFCKKRLNLKEDATHFEIYEKLVTEIIHFYELLIEKIKPAGNKGQNA